MVHEIHQRSPDDFLDSYAPFKVSPASIIKARKILMEKGHVTEDKVSGIYELGQVLMNVEGVRVENFGNDVEVTNTRTVIGQVMRRVTTADNTGRWIRNHHHAWESSEGINCWLEEDNKRPRCECKVLLLGKDAILTQMKIDLQGGLTKEQLLEYRSAVYWTVIDSTCSVIKYMRSAGIECNEPSNARLMGRILESEVGNPVVTLVLEDYMSHVYHMESAEYFLKNIIHISSSGYIPTEEDALRTRERKEDVTDTPFNADGTLEHRSQNRMRTTLVLFDSVINSRWFARTSIILVLTKFKEFKAKLSRVPLSGYFEEYTGGADLNKAAKYILWKFMQVNRARLSVYPHLAQTNIKIDTHLIFAVVKETILQNALKDVGSL
ncbi:hypothetical protein NP233_g12963 [Leucocoprinus birnbaumii]|uniref:Uncharacterized protein n=1 Tax=Leucocoprinus birnbaumii TaxID=56174 RepID=A0AAD5VDJ4_9AGAR|nr:hypothetical protein NP233_g12963 [Leucocoprinus birnbaumii]